jgi:hypothetical protein
LLITIHRVLAGQKNRGDKMSLVYDFVTSGEFRLPVEAIVEGFTQMQGDLETEKRAMARNWKRRVEADREGAAEHQQHVRIDPGDCGERDTGGEAFSVAGGGRGG